MAQDKAALALPRHFADVRPSNPPCRKRGSWVFHEGYLDISETGSAIFILGSGASEANFLSAIAPITGAIIHF